MPFPASIDLASLDGINGFRIDGVAATDVSGRAVSGAGDLNGDGFDDVLIGAPRPSPNGREYAGSSYVVFGRAGAGAPSVDLASLDGTNGFRLDGANAFDFSGSALGGAGDFNGDGIDDLVIGVAQADPDGRAEAGVSYVVFGRRGGFATSLDLASLDGVDGLRIAGVNAADRSGYSVSGAGDVNGDGLDDLIIGGSFNANESYVVFGARGGLGAGLDLAALDGGNGFRIRGIDPNDGSGSAVSGAGDVNGDGLADVIVGANGAAADGKTNSGESYVVFGRRGGFAASVDLASLSGADGFRLDGVSAGDQSGNSVSGAGDVNGDGFDDLVVGAALAGPDGRIYAGASYVVFGARGGLGASLDLAALDGSNGFRVDGIAAGDRSGNKVRGAGDVDGDGFADIIIGAAYTGASYVVFGRPGGFAATLDLASLDGTNGFRLDGEVAADFRGEAVSGAGDVNGDGLDDVIIGASSADADGLDNAGESYVVFGRDSSVSAVVAVDDVGVTAPSGAAVIDILANDRTETRLGLTLDDLTGPPTLAGQPDGGLAYLLADGRLLVLASEDAADGVSLALDYRITGPINDDGAAVAVTVERLAGTPILSGSQGGGPDADTLTGAARVNRLFGGNGDDTLFGYLGGNTLDGGADADVLIANGPSNQLTGGAGADLFVLTEAPARRNDFQIVADFALADGDRLLLAIEGLVEPDGRVDLNRLSLRASRGDTLLLADFDGEAATGPGGKEAVLARLEGGAGLTDVGALLFEGTFIA